MHAVALPLVVTVIPFVATLAARSNGGSWGRALVVALSVWAAIQIAYAIGLILGYLLSPDEAGEGEARQGAASGSAPRPVAWTPETQRSGQGARWIKREAPRASTRSGVA